MAAYPLPSWGPYGGWEGINMATKPVRRLGVPRAGRKEEVPCRGGFRPTKNWSGDPPQLYCPQPPPLQSMGAECRWTVGNEARHNMKKRHKAKLHYITLHNIILGSKAQGLCPWQYLGPGTHLLVCAVLCSVRVHNCWPAADLKHHFTTDNAGLTTPPSPQNQGSAQAHQHEGSDRGRAGMPCTG